MSGLKGRREAQAAYSEHVEARRLRMAELLADPARAHYAPLVERGEDWSDENIRYFENPDETITCVHLQPIERAMRHAGVPARRYREADVTATCCIDYDLLKRDFDMDAPARYREFWEGERAEHDYAMAFLLCDEHKCMIYTIHPEDPKAEGAARFPHP